MGSLLTQPLNDIVSSSWKFYYLNESFFFLILKMNIELFSYNVIGMSCNKLMKLFKWCREYILIDPGPIDRYVLYNKEVHQYSLIWEENDPGKLHCRRREANFYRNSVLDACIIPYLQQSGFYGVAWLGFISLDWHLITTFIERWRPETHTFHVP